MRSVATSGPAPHLLEARQQQGCYLDGEARHALGVQGLGFGILLEGGDVEAAEESRVRSGPKREGECAWGGLAELVTQAWGFGGMIVARWKVVACKQVRVLQAQLCANRRALRSDSLYIGFL